MRLPATLDQAARAIAPTNVAVLDMIFRRRIRKGKVLDIIDTLRMIADEIESAYKDDFPESAPGCKPSVDKGSDLS